MGRGFRNPDYKKGNYGCVTDFKGGVLDANGRVTDVPASVWGRNW